jgi:hypothetical protein
MKHSIYPFLLLCFLTLFCAVLNTELQAMPTFCSSPSTPVCSTPHAGCTGSGSSVLVGTGSGTTIFGTGSIGALSYSYWTDSIGGTLVDSSTSPPGTQVGDNLVIPDSLPAGIYVYYVQADSGPCSSSRQQIIYEIYAKPDLPVFSYTFPICAGIGINIIPVTSDSSVRVTYWNDFSGGVLIDTSTSPPGIPSGNNLYIPANTPAGLYPFYVQTENAGCTRAEREIRYVEIIDTPGTPVFADSFFTCSQHQLNVSYVGSFCPDCNYTFWSDSLGGGLVDSSTVPPGLQLDGFTLKVPSYAAPGRYFYYVQAEIPGCHSVVREPIEVVIDTTPSTPNCVDTIFSCQGPILTIIGEGSDFAERYTFWSDLINDYTDRAIAPGSYTDDTFYTQIGQVPGVYTYYVQAQRNTCRSIHRDSVIVLIDSIPSIPSFTMRSTLY